MCFTLLGFRPSLTLMMLGHIVVVAPFVLRTTSASMSETKGEKERSMMIVAKPLNADEFAPYGDVLAPPSALGRVYFDQGLRSTRPAAWPSLSVSHAKFLPSLPLEATVMERHEFSSQSFLPLDVSRWLVVVAPPGANGGPDGSRAVAFLAGPGQGVTYHAGTWHHPLTILDRPGRFAVVMWRDGTRTDEEFRPLATPFTVEVRD